MPYEKADCLGFIRCIIGNSMRGPRKRCGVGSGYSRRVSACAHLLYSVVIPADMEIPFGSLDTEIGRVYADVMKIEKGKAVYVEVDSQKAYNLVNTANAAYGIAYALAGADAICFNRVNDPTQFPLNALIEQKTWDAAYAGDYEDTLLFTITYR